MIVFTLIGYLVLFGVCGVVSLYCAASLLKKNDRIGSLREFEKIRLIPIAVVLVIGVCCVLFPRRSELCCERVSGVVTCTIEQRRLLSSYHRLLPPNGILGSEVEEQLHFDREGYPEQQSRLVVITAEGRFAVNDFGNKDGHRLQRELQGFLSDPSQHRVKVGQDTRWFFYPQVPMWLLLFLWLLLCRW